MANEQTLGLFQQIDHATLNPNETAATLDSGLLMSAMMYDLAQHNADIDAMLALFAESTTEYQEEVQTQTTARNQAVDEFARAKPIKPGVPYTVAYPLYGSGQDAATTYIASQTMTVGDLAKRLQAWYRGDVLWVRDQILGALFSNTDLTYRDITGKGNLTIKPLANGDSVTYIKSGVEDPATDTHYLFQAASIDDSNNPYTTIYDDLIEHPDNEGDVIHLIPTGLKATTKALTDFYEEPDPRITLGQNDSRLNATLGITLPTNWSVLGIIKDAGWIVECPPLPAGYILSLMTAGRRPLKRRQYKQETLQGFRPMGTREDFPYFSDQWQRWEGYGAFNRVGAAATLVGAGAYSVPTNYTRPIR